MDNIRVPPHNLEAEIALLCCCIRAPQNIQEIHKVISVDHFYRTSHQVIYQALCDLGKGTDLVTLSESLRQSGNLETVGGVPYLSDIATAYSVSVNYPYYCDILSNLATKRSMISICSDISSRCFVESDNIDQIIQSAKTRFSEVQAKDPYFFKSVVDISNVYTPDRMLEEYEKYIGDLKKNRFRTGMDEIDKRIRGVSGGETLFIIARAGCFKTAILQNLLKNYVDHSSWGAVFFSIEMPVSSITERYQEIITGQTGKDIEEKYIDSIQGYPEKTEDIKIEFKEKMKGIYLIPTAVSVKNIIQYVKIIEAEYRQKIGLIGIDYLGLMDSAGKNEYESVSNVSRELKSMAKLLNLPVVIISQTSRKAGSGETEIALDHGRGSGAIEENADFVLGLFKHDDDVICKILKNRKGTTGTNWILELDKSTLKLGDYCEYWEPEEEKKNEVW